MSQTTGIEWTDRMPHSGTQKSRPGLMPDHTPVCPLPVISTLSVTSGWTAKIVGEGPKQCVALSRKGPVGDCAPIAAHVVRDYFAAITNLEDAASFFENYGALYDSQANPSQSYSLQKIQGVQEDLRRLRTMKREKFFGPKNDVRDLFNTFPLALRIARAPYLHVEANNVWDAMLRATYIDQWEGARAGTCLECKKPFSMPGGRRKFYCGKLCQSRAGKRKWNKNKARRRGSSGPTRPGTPPGAARR